MLVVNFKKKKKILQTDKAQITHDEVQIERQGGWSICLCDMTKYERYKNQQMKKKRH